MAERYRVEVPGSSRTVEIVPAGAGGFRVEVDGAPAPRAGVFSPTYPVPLDDGGTFPLAVNADLRGGFVVKGPGLDTRVGKSHSLALGILAFLPFGLIAMGGALGGLLGAVAMVINRRIATTEMPEWLRAVLMLGVTALAGVLLFMVAAVIQIALR